MTGNTFYAKTNEKNINLIHRSARRTDNIPQIRRGGQVYTDSIPQIDTDNVFLGKSRFYLIKHNKLCFAFVRILHFYKQAF